MERQITSGGAVMLHSLGERFDHVVVFDVETTGFDPKGEEIIEFSALRLRKKQAGFAPEQALSFLVRLSEGRRLPEAISRLTGIREQQLTGEGISKEAACEKLSKFLDCPNPLLAAYNAQFDLCFLYYFLAPFGKAGLLKNAKLLDALTVYKDRRPYPHTLGDAAAAYGLQSQNTHRAMDDAKATLELLCAMERELDDLLRYVNLFGYNPKYGVSGPKISSVSYLPQPYGMAGKLYER